MWAKIEGECGGVDAITADEARYIWYEIFHDVIPFFVKSSQGCGDLIVTYITIFCKEYREVE